VNAAGPWAAWVAEALGYSVPCRAVPRQVSIIASRDVDLSAHGMIVDTSGCYFHHEGGELILAGYSPPGDPPGHGFDHEGRAFFEREIWPRLAARSTRFDRLEHVRGWTGLYELSPDNSALLGAVTGAPDTFEIHSFSGRGVMQSDAAARALAELMTTGAFQTADASALTGRRFATGDLQPEELHI
jgi:glycine/D-amino acid oxidase-like deaminating enzyme